MYLRVLVRVITWAVLVILKWGPVLYCHFLTSTHWMAMMLFKIFVSFYN